MRMIACVPVMKTRSLVRSYLSSRETSRSAVAAARSASAIGRFLLEAQRQSAGFRSGLCIYVSSTDINANLGQRKRTLCGWREYGARRVRIPTSHRRDAAIDDE